MNIPPDKTILSNITRLKKEGKYQEAFKELSKIAKKSDDYVSQSKYAKLFRSFPQNSLKELVPLKIALLSSTTDVFFRDILGFWLSQAGFYPIFHETLYDATMQTVLDTNSAFYKFDPEIVWIFTTYRDFKGVNNIPGNGQALNAAVDKEVSKYASLWATIKKRLKAQVIQNNADLPPFRVLGNYDAIAQTGTVNIFRKYNCKLSDTLPEGVTVFDLDYVSSKFGKDRWFEACHWYNSKIPFSLEAAGEVAYQGARLIASMKGGMKKCLVLDLDNTLWGGVIGDSGLNGIALGEGAVGEAYIDFQEYILDLQKRGIILAVCSKNDEEKAKEPFLKHPDMRLKLDHISVFKANWGNKADNIKKISHALNIGLDSMVFLDDNPVERDLVRNFLPMVSVPELPEDPSLYRKVLDEHCYFETTGLSEEDLKRTEYYKSNISREELKNEFGDLTAYLESLEMKAMVGGVDEFHLSRIVQLINKSNQFHLTTTRYNENEIIQFSRNADYICAHFSLEDKFGDNGLISVVILRRDGKKFHIDTWCMSCRVLSRGMEEFICGEMASLVLQKGAEKIVGKYIPTRKNKLVSDLYATLGFTLLEKQQDGTTLWELDLNSSCKNKKSCISKKTKD